MNKKIKRITKQSTENTNSLKFFKIVKYKKPGLLKRGILLFSTLPHFAWMGVLRVTLSLTNNKREQLFMTRKALQQSDLCRLPTICDKSVTCEKHARCDTSCCLCCFMRQISRVLHLEPSCGRSDNYARDKGIFLCDKE